MKHLSLRLAAVTGSIIMSVVFFSTCVYPGSGTVADLRGDEYAGPEACVACHRAVYDSCLRTAHNHTSREANSLTVKGNFEPPGNTFVYRPGMQVVMERRHSGLYQVGKVDGTQEEHRFDVVIGSGRKAQTFVYWKGDEALQLPVSWFVILHQWANSPDFPPDRIWWDRTIPSRCFECHTSYIGRKEPIRTDAFHTIDQFDHDHVLYGIDCERCHGPGAAHIRYQTAHPEDHTSHDIVRFTSLSRQQKLDMCAVCHSGTREMQRSGFEFRPGDTLANFVYPQSDASGSASKMDVHGNQYQLMIASKCFQQTQTLECNTCHAVHQRERDDLARFSARCMNCHAPGTQPGSSEGSPTAHPGVAPAASEAPGPGSPGTVPFCKLTTLPVAILEKNCIDCHMPLKASRVITLLTQSGAEPVANKVRNHLVAIYPDATRAFIDSLKRKGG